jgi:hypothetical protein
MAMIEKMRINKGQDTGTLVGRKTLFVSKQCVAPVFCVIVPLIYEITNKLL